MVLTPETFAAWFVGAAMASAVWAILTWGWDNIPDVIRRIVNSRKDILAAIPIAISTAAVQLGVDLGDARKAEALAVWFVNALCSLLVIGQIIHDARHGSKSDGTVKTDANVLAAVVEELKQLKAQPRPNILRELIKENIVAPPPKAE